MSQFLRKHGFIYDQLPVILWALFIFISSSIPNIALPEFKVFSSDKLAHLIVYGVFTALTHRALAYQNRFPKLAMHSLLWSFILTVIYEHSTSSINSSCRHERQVCWILWLIQLVHFYSLLTNS